jgi:hypothetical protein
LTVRPTEEVAAEQVKAQGAAADHWGRSEFLHELHLRRRSTHEKTKILTGFSQRFRSN